MALHLLKLCVGAESIADLSSWIAERRAAAEAAGRTYEQTHTTRMVPTRAAELLDGGSLYWVIKGQLSARQKLLDIRPFVDGEGIRRCHLVLEPEVVPVLPRPSRAFQGWRYLAVKDAPTDLGGGDTGADLPEALRRELSQLGLL
ncbi:DUF1489 family protein [Xanthobacter pseudotagetidis]|uniref:DUF1489 family protein n=1 Tax=Xanthobacter pseudotagetidis TaxID=3119911 RepID=UPI00372BAEE3